MIQKKRKGGAKLQLITTYERAQVLRLYHKSGDIPAAVRKTFPDKPPDMQTRIAKSVMGFVIHNGFHKNAVLNEYLKGFRQ